MFKYLLLKSIYDLSDVDVVERSKYVCLLNYKQKDDSYSKNEFEPSFLIKLFNLV